MIETYFAGIAKRLGRQNTSVGTRQGTARLAQSDHNKWLIQGSDFMTDNCVWLWFSFG
jgi:hypothetical protein